MYQGRILELSDTMMYARDEYINKIKKYTVNEGDVILAIVGNTLGMVSTIGKSLNNANLTENCCKFVDIDTRKVLPLFLYYSLISPLNQEKIEKFKVGSSQPKLPLYNVGQLLVSDIVVCQQRKIIRILSAIDSKIECNQKICAELESMAKTLYDYWFVQFDFPDENGNPYRTSGGEMIWNEKIKREIPNGWGITSVGKVTMNFDSQRVPLSQNQRESIKGTIPYYGATGVMDYVNDYIFDGQYVLIAEDGSVMDNSGHPIVQMIWDKTWVNNHAHVLRGINNYSNEILYFVLKDIPVVKIMTGSIQKKINQENLNNYRIPSIPESLLNLFFSYTKDVFEKIHQLELESKELLTLRDWLLPVLMNGQAKVE